MLYFSIYKVYNKLIISLVAAVLDNKEDGKDDKIKFHVHIFLILKCRQSDI